MIITTVMFIWVTPLRIPNSVIQNIETDISLNFSVLSILVRFIETARARPN